MAYHRLQWTKPIPGLFHAQMHTPEAIVKLCWGSDATDDYRVVHCSLQYSANKMARHFVNPKKQTYSDARTVVKDNLYGQIVVKAHTRPVEYFLFFFFFFFILLSKYTALYS